MNLKTFCKVAFSIISLVGVSSIYLPNNDNLSIERPNILFCIADDWGWPHAGAYGDSIINTPTFIPIIQVSALAGLFP